MHTKNHIAQWLSMQDGGKVLELASGSGKYTTEIYPYFKSFISWTVTDPDSELLAKAKLVLNDQRFLFSTVKAEKIPYPDRCFNTVIISRGLHHLSNIEQAVLEMIRVLVPGGYILINEMYSESRNEAQKNQFLWHQLRIEIDRELRKEHYPVFSRSELFELLKGYPVKLIALFDYVPENSIDIEKRIQEYRMDLKNIENPSLFRVLSERLENLILRTEKFGIENQPHLFLAYQKTT